MKQIAFFCFLLISFTLSAQSNFKEAVSYKDGHNIYSSQVNYNASAATISYGKSPSNNQRDKKIGIALISVGSTMVLTGLPLLQLSRTIGAGATGLSIGLSSAPFFIAGGIKISRSRNWSTENYSSINLKINPSIQSTNTHQFMNSTGAQNYALGASISLNF